MTQDWISPPVPSHSHKKTPVLSQSQENGSRRIPFTCFVEQTGENTLFFLKDNRTTSIMFKIKTFFAHGTGDTEVESFVAQATKL